jgi:hypothetical protein
MQKHLCKTVRKFAGIFVGFPTLFSATLLNCRQQKHGVKILLRNQGLSFRKKEQHRG